MSGRAVESWLMISKIRRVNTPNFKRHFVTSDDICRIHPRALKVLDFNDARSVYSEAVEEHESLTRKALIFLISSSLLIFWTVKRRNLHAHCSDNSSGNVHYDDVKAEDVWETCGSVSSGLKSKSCGERTVHFASEKENNSLPQWLAEQMRVTAAYHEAGHAVCAWFSPHVKQVCEVSIVQDERRGGYTKYHKHANAKTEDELFEQICVDLAGMAAEELFLGGITPLSNSDDLADANHLATIGFSRLYVQLGLASRNYTEEEKTQVEKTLTITLICKAYGRTVDMLREHQEDVRKIANLLLERGTLSTQDMAEVLGKRPSIRRPGFF